MSSPIRQRTAVDARGEKTGAASTIVRARLGEEAELHARGCCGVLYQSALALRCSRNDEAPRVTRDSD